MDGSQGNDPDTANSGAAYVFARSGTDWIQQSYLKASNTQVSDAFGSSVAVSGDTVIAGAMNEDSNATVIKGDESNNGASNSGAVYAFTGGGVPAQLSIAPDGTGGYLIRSVGHVGWTNRLQRAIRATGPWTNILAQVTPDSALVEFHDPSSPTGQAFYRMLQP